MNHDLLLRKIAWDFSQKSGLEINDLFQEASLAYLEALRTYDPAKSRISTYVWHCVSNKLKNYIGEEEIQKCRKFGNELHSIEEIQTPVYKNEIPFWESLNKEAQIITKTILKNSEEFCRLPSDEAQIKIAKVMLEKGMNWKNILLGMQNLRKIYA